MAAKQRLGQIRSQIGKLGRDSLDVVANANRIVTRGIQKLAEQELKALNDYYRNAMKSLKGRGDASLKDVAIAQLDLMQETVNRVIAHARESLSIIADARAELTRLVDRDEGALSQKALTKVAAPAQKAIAEVRKAAASTARDVRRTLEKEMVAVEKKGQEALKKGKDAVKSGRAKAEEVGKDALKKGKAAVSTGRAKAGEVGKDALKKGRQAVKSGKARAEEVGKVVKQKVGSVLDIAAPAPVTKKAVQAKPSPESRANRATSKAKKHVPAIPVTSTMPPKKDNQ